MREYLVALVAAACLAAPASAAVTYSLASANGGFSVTLPSFITANRTFTNSQLTGASPFLISAQFCPIGTECGYSDFIAEADTIYTITDGAAFPVPPGQPMVSNVGRTYAFGPNTFTTVAVSTSTASSVSSASVLRVDDGTLVGSGVPEPATWALMIAGFGLVGGAMRRRRVAIAG